MMFYVVEVTNKKTREFDGEFLTQEIDLFAQADEFVGTRVGFNVFLNQSNIHVWFIKLINPKNMD